MQINDFLENATNKFPHKEAVWHNDKWITYSEINNQSNKIANYLIKKGIKREDKIALLYENSFNFIISYFAILKIGCVVVALNTEATEEDLIYLINDSESKAIIADKKYTQKLIPALKKSPYLLEVIIEQEDISQYLEIGHCNTVSLKEVFEKNNIENPCIRCIDMDLAAIVYTSGSTGKPKGVMLSHLNLVSNMHSIVEYLHLTENDRIMVILPFYYIYGLSLLLTHFLVGGSIVIDNRFLYPNTVLETMKKTNVTGFAGVPSTFMILLNRSAVRDYDFNSLRYITQAGGAMAPAVQKDVVKVFSSSDLYIMYGATEAAPRLSYLEPSMLNEKWGSIGTPVSNVDLFVADEKGNRLQVGETGEIAARGSNIMVGYWKDPDGTEQVLKNGLYYTGDLGKTDEDGYIFVVGRVKDIIKVKGFRVGAKEIEETILEMNEVHETAVIGVDDPVLGEAIKAFIIPREKTDLTEENIINFLKDKLPAYKLPKYIEFRNMLPKNKSGKILKSKLKEEQK